MRSRVGWSSPAQRSTRRNVKAEGWRCVLVIGLVLLTGSAFYLAASSYAGSFYYIATDGQKLALIATPGETISLNVYVANTVNGDWGSPSGLQLHLNGVGTFSIVSPKPDDWGSYLTTHDSLNGGTPITVGGDFTVPSSLAHSRQNAVDGYLSGAIDYPAPDGNGMFSNAGFEVNVPLHLQLVSSASVPWFGREIILYATALSTSLLLALLPLLLRFYDTRLRSWGMFDPRHIRPRNQNPEALGCSLLLVVLLYGGGLMLGLGLVIGHSSGFYIREIYGLALVQTLILLATTIRTLIKARLWFQSNRVR